jgi:hypothetical protein
MFYSTTSEMTYKGQKINRFAEKFLVKLQNAKYGLETCLEENKDTELCEGRRRENDRLIIDYKARIEETQNHLNFLEQENLLFA